MKHILRIFALLTLVAGLARAEEVRKLSLDDASVIGTTIQTDTQVRAEGKPRSRSQLNGPRQSAWAKSFIWTSKMQSWSTKPK